MTVKKSTAVAKKESTAVAPNDYGEYAGSGFENTKPEDLSIPFMAILQSNSPQVTENDPEGAKMGQIYNTVTKELLEGDTGFNFLPVHSDTHFVEWVPRDSGGGIVGMYSVDHDIVKNAIAANDGNRIGKLKHGENDVVETHYVYGLLLNEEGTQTTGFAVLAFKSTGIKPKRDWFTSMYTLKGKPPLFANRASIKTVKQKKDTHTFYNYRIGPLKETWLSSLIHPQEEKALLDEAVEFKSMVINGMARADFTQERAAGDTEDEEMPF